MRKERDALALQRTTKLRVREEAVDSKQAHAGCLRELGNEAIRRMEIRLVRDMSERPVRLGTVLLLEHGGEVQIPALVRLHRYRGTKRPPGEIVLHPNVRWRPDL